MEGATTYSGTRPSGSSVSPAASRRAAICARPSGGVQGCASACPVQSGSSAGRAADNDARPSPQPLRHLVYRSRKRLLHPLAVPINGRVDFAPARRQDRHDAGVIDMRLPDSGIGIQRADADQRLPRHLRQRLGRRDADPDARKRAGAEPDREGRHVGQRQPIARQQAVQFAHQPPRKGAPALKDADGLDRAIFLGQRQNAHLAACVKCRKVMVISSSMMASAVWARANVNQTGTNSASNATVIAEVDAIGFYCRRSVRHSACHDCFGAELVRCILLIKVREVFD